MILFRLFSATSMPWSPPVREKVLVQEAEIAALKGKDRPGRDGVGVVNMFIDQSGTLVHTLSDGTAER